MLFSITFSTGWALVGGLSVLFVLLFLLSGMIGPMPRYSISSPNDLLGNDTESFLNVLESLTDAKVERDMDHDLMESRRVSMEDWIHRPFAERATELLGWVIERQQR